MLFHFFILSFISSFLISRLSKQLEHIALVGFNSWLIERVDTKYEAAYAASLFEEVDELT